jgi:AraC-like DNA-binding protein
LVLDTAAVPSRERLDFVVESLAGAASATSFTPATERDGVYLRMSVWDLGGVEVFDTECSAHTLVRSGRSSSDEAPELLLTYALKGTGVHSQPSHEVTVRESMFWATDLPAPYEHRISDTRTLTAKISHDVLGIPVDVVSPALEHLHRSPLAPLFKNHFTELRRTVNHLDGVAALSLGSATLSLARALVASVSTDSRLGRDTMEDALLLRVKAFAREHLGDSGLDAETIAAAHFVSVRHLYKVCAAAGLRLEQWIIEERLARAAEDLARTAAVAISEVARRWGFTSAAHFATRFRRTYGVSPREWRDLNHPGVRPGVVVRSMSRDSFTVARRSGPGSSG